jgi:hypothetical protein
LSGRGCEEFEYGGEAPDDEICAMKRADS